MKKPFISALLMFGCFIASGCTQRVADLTVASTKNINIAGDSHRADVTERVTGEDKVAIVAFIPTGRPNIKEALDRAIEKRPGAVGLSDVTLSTKFYYIPLLYGEIGYVIEGNPVYKK